MAAGEEEEENLWTKKHQNMSVEILGSLLTYVPVFSTANASLTASFTVVTRSSWGKGSHCVREGGEEGGVGGGGAKEEERKEEERRGRSQQKRKGRKRRKRRDGDGRKGKRRVVKNVKLLNPSQHTYTLYSQRQC